MKKLGALVLVIAFAAAAQAELFLDDFSGDLSAYTSTVILDANGGSQNTASWQIGGGALQLNTTAYDGIQQYAMIRDGLSLAVGEELQVDIAVTGASQDIGLYVGGTTPVAGVRQDYIAMYARSTGELFSRGFDGTSEYGQVGWISPAYEKLFIARTDVNTFEVGYYEAGARNVLTTRNPSYANAATVCGFYADVRAAGVLGNADNLTVVPEPTTALLLGLGSLALIRRR